jgi:hypothetical protein
MLISSFPPFFFFCSSVFDSLRCANGIVMKWANIALVLTEFTSGRKIEKQNNYSSCNEDNERGKHRML